MNIFLIYHNPSFCYKFVYITLRRKKQNAKAILVVRSKLLKTRPSVF